MRYRLMICLAALQSGLLRKVLGISTLEDFCPKFGGVAAKMALTWKDLWHVIVSFEQ